VIPKSGLQESLQQNCAILLPSVIRPMMGAFRLVKTLFLSRATPSFLLFHTFNFLGKVTRIKAFLTYAENCRPQQQPHERKIQLPNNYSTLPISKLGNALVTELLLKSAYYCPLQIVQLYANNSVSSSLSVGLHQFRFFFLFKD
jgi:hypothetical protein